MARKRTVFSDINITPLTDIFLVLLIIMMVIAPLLDQQGLSLTVPDNVESKDVQEHKTVNITIDNEDKFFINDEEVSADNLENKIKELAKVNKEEHCSNLNLSSPLSFESVPSTSKRITLNSLLSPTHIPFVVWARPLSSLIISKFVLKT